MNKFLTEIARTLSSKKNLEELESMPVSGFGEVRVTIQRETPDTFKLVQTVEATIKLRELKELQNRGVV